MRRQLFTARWLGLTAAMIALAAAFCVLGAWQWHRATADGNARSLGYSLEWPAFAIMVVVMYVKTFREELRGDRKHSPPPPHGEDDGGAEFGGRLARRRARREAARRRFHPSGGVVGAPSLGAQPAESYARLDPEDEELAAYNRYLAEVNARVARR